DPLLQLFLVVVGGGFLDLGADLLDPGFDVVVGTGAVDDGGVFLGQLDLLGLAEVFQGDLFQAHAEVFGDDLAAGQHRHVFEHGLAPITKAGRLGGGDLDDAAHVVDHQRGQRFAFHVFGNDHQRAIGLGDVLQQRQHVADIGDLLVVQKNVGVLQFRLHGLAVGDEVRRQVATVELPAFDHVEFIVQAGAFLDRDHAFLADLVHGIGNDAADFFVRVGGDGADLGDGLFVVAGLGLVGQFRDGGFHTRVDAALEVHRVHASGHGLDTLAHDRLGEDGGGGGAVAGDIGGLGGDFLHHLRAHVLELVFQFDFLGHGNAVLGNGRRAEALVEYHVAALGPQRHLDGIGQRVDPAK